MTIELRKLGTLTDGIKDIPRGDGRICIHNLIFYGNILETRNANCNGRPSPIQLVVEDTNQMANTYEYGQQRGAGAEGSRVHKIKNRAVTIK